MKKKQNKTKKLHAFSIIIEDDMAIKLCQYASNKILKQFSKNFRKIIASLKDQKQKQQKYEMRPVFVSMILYEESAEW